MHADRSIEIGIGRAHDGRRGAAGRQPGNVDTPRFDRVLAHDLSGDAGDQRGFTLAAPLVARAEPIPAPLRIGSTVLRRVGHQKGALFGQRVHARAGGEVVG